VEGELSMTHLNVPSSLPEAVEAELISDLGSIHGIRQILLVGEDEEESIAKLILIQHPLQLLASLRNTLSIIGVHNENDTLGVLEVCREEGLRRKATIISGDVCRRTMPPEGANLILTSDIPHGE
jgi:hypothetical protein